MWYVLANTLESGKTYLIVGRNTAGTGYALTNNSSAQGRGTAVTVKTSSGTPYIEVEATDTMLWTINGSGTSYTFKNGSYYHQDMGGSNSIKAVLPALYPNDPELDYHALPVVHNGGEAMDIYPKMLVASPSEKERIRDGLLKYCCLDTLAMVKVLRKVKECVKD